jgi:hypothetical protein
VLPACRSNGSLGLAVRHTIETIKYVTIVIYQIDLNINVSNIIYMINRNKTHNASQEIEIDIRKCLDT